MRLTGAKTEDDGDPVIDSPGLEDEADRVKGANEDPSAVSWTNWDIHYWLLKVYPLGQTAVHTTGVPSWANQGTH